MQRASSISLDELRRYVVARSLFAPTTLARAIVKLGFVQADPIRAPARAQDLTLRHRVAGYRAGDLERTYPRLAVEEDFFVNYGFLPRATHALMHPRVPNTPWPRADSAKAQALLAFVRERGTVHPRDVDAHFQHGKVRNFFGGQSNASTQLLERMHYRSLLRVAGRDAGIRLYAACEPAPPRTDPGLALDALVDVILRQYAPLPERSLGELVWRLRFAAPQWQAERRAAFARAKARLPHADAGGMRWYWPKGETPRARSHTAAADADRVRLLAPFDPVVWDRRRFEQLWGWAYRFEAYTPAAKRKLGYYALPLLWRDRVVGWGNLALRDGRLEAKLGYVRGRPPSDRGFAAALDEELSEIARFLGAGDPDSPPSA